MKTVLKALLPAFVIMLLLCGGVNAQSGTASDAAAVPESMVMPVSGCVKSLFIPAGTYKTIDIGYVGKGQGIIMSVLKNSASSLLVCQPAGALGPRCNVVNTKLGTTVWQSIFPEGQSYVMTIFNAGDKGTYIDCLLQTA